MITPVYRDIARQGLKRMESERSSEGAGAAGHECLTGIADGVSIEAMLAGATLRACAHDMRDSSEVAAQRIALRVLADGVSGPLGQVLAHVGCASLDQAWDVQDGRVLGSSFLREISSTSKDPVEATAARVAWESADRARSDESASHVLQKALSGIRGGLRGDVPAVLADLGTNAATSETSSEDARRMYAPLLSGIQQEGTKAERVLAKTALDILQADVRDASAGAAARIAFETLKSGARGEPEIIIARFADTVMQQAGSDVDAALMGHVALRSVASTTEHAAVRKIVADARGALEQTDSARASMRLQSQILDSAARIAAAVTSVSFPDVDTSLPIDQALAQLETRATTARDSASRVRLELVEHGQRVREIDVRLADIMRELKPFERGETPLAKHASLAGHAMFVGLAATVAGGWGAYSGFHLVGGVVALAGLGTLVAVRHYYKNVMVNDTDNGESLQVEQNALRAERHELFSGLAPRRELLKKLDGVLEQDKPRLDLLRMASIQPPDATAAVTLEPTTVKIGSLIVDRRQER